MTTASGRTTYPVRARTVDADLVLLNMMLRWATTVREPSGERWLAENPLQGIRRPREPNPKRPVATWERFVKTRAAMRALADGAGSDAECQRWIRMELALILAESTGRRLGSIRQLQWDDIDFEHSTIRWRAEADKKRRESVVPVPACLLEELRTFRTRLGVIAGWVFARESDGVAPMDRHLFHRWLTVAERHADLPKLEGGSWHPYRRKWATERKHLPLSDVAEAGGWKDRGTLLECYQQPDADTLLKVMEAGHKLRNPSVAPEKQQRKQQPHAG
jgi:integrase